MFHFSQKKKRKKKAYITDLPLNDLWNIQVKEAAEDLLKYSRSAILPFKHQIHRIWW